MMRKAEAHGHNKQRLAMRLASTTRIVTDSVRSTAGAKATEGLAVVIEVTPGLLAASRRQGGLLQTASVVEANGLMFGVLAITGDDCGHLVVLPLGTEEVNRLLKTADTVGNMRVVMADRQGDGRVAVLDRRTVDEVLRSRDANQGVATTEVLKVLFQVVAYLASNAGARAMPELIRRLDRVTVHALVPESLLDAVIESMPFPQGIVH